MSPKQRERVKYAQGTLHALQGYTSPQQWRVVRLAIQALQEALDAPPVREPGQTYSFDDFTAEKLLRAAVRYVPADALTLRKQARKLLDPKRSKLPLVERVR